MALLHTSLKRCNWFIKLMLGRFILWNHRRIYVGRDFRGLWTKAPIQVGITLKLGKVGHGLVQLSFENLQGWRFHSPSEQPVAAFNPNPWRIMESFSLEKTFWVQPSTQHYGHDETMSSSATSTRFIEHSWGWWNDFQPKITSNTWRKFTNQPLLGKSKFHPLDGILKNKIKAWHCSIFKDLVPTALIFAGWFNSWLIVWGFWYTKQGSVIDDSWTMSPAPLKLLL